MSSRRTEKLAQAIKEQVSTTILLHMRDPRVKNVTVTGVEVSPDVRSAKVSVSVMGDEKEQVLCMHGLESARGFLQSRVADRIQTRYTPILSFKLDPGIKKSIEASQVLRETELALSEKKEEAGPDTESAESDTEAASEASAGPEEAEVNRTEVNEDGN